MRDPEDYCQKCDRRYGATEESCSGCGFSPVTNPDDGKEYDAAIETYNNWRHQEDGPSD